MGDGSHRVSMRQRREISRKAVLAHSPRGTLRQELFLASGSEGRRIQRNTEGAPRHGDVAYAFQQRCSHRGGLAVGMHGAGG